MSKTIYDVAREAGVAISTVSRVINKSGYVSEKTREKVQKAMKGYHPNSAAREMVTKRTMTLGLIISHDPEYFFTNSVYSKVLIGISVIAKQNNYRLLIDVNKTEYDYTILFKQKKVDGLILLGAQEKSKYLQKLAIEGFPFVLIGDYLENDIHLPRVEVNDKQAVSEAIGHLVLLGHEKIAIVNGPLAFASGLNRLKAYQDTLTAKGIDYNEQYVEVVRNISEEAGYQAGKKLLSLEEDKPTAVFAFNDTIAVGIYKAVKELGLSIPQDLSVVGFDDSEVSKYLNPPLTTIRQPGYEKGLEAAKLLIDIIENGSDKYSDRFVLKYLSGQLIIRSSCAAPSHEK